MFAKIIYFINFYQTQLVKHDRKNIKKEKNYTLKDKKIKIRKMYKKYKKPSTSLIKIYTWVSVPNVAAAQSNKNDTNVIFLDIFAYFLRL